MCPKDINAPSDATYLIVLHDYVVMQDIAGTIRDYDNSARIIARTDWASALAETKTVQSLEMAFVEAAPADFRRSLLFAAITARQGRIVYFGPDAEDSSDVAGSQILYRPFSSEMVLACLMATPLI